MAQPSGQVSRSVMGFGRAVIHLNALNSVPNVRADPVVGLESHRFGRRSLGRAVGESMRLGAGSTHGQSGRSVPRGTDGYVKCKGGSIAEPRLAEIGLVPLRLRTRSVSEGHRCRARIVRSSSWGAPQVLLGRGRGDLAY